jgi:poly(A) polymerase
MEPVIRPRAEHNISRKNIDPDALKVLYRLHNSGFRAFLVGGGVRDMLLARRPKDFDIGTDAHPNEIRSLFRNARLIGRRFRLAHIVFGPKVIEVSTFRTKSEFTNEDEADLLIRRDNTFGTPEEDALRRDFTVNGLFYDIASYSVIDYVGGLQDLERKLIRSIGDAAIRFREDPIRILRAVKFAARLRFEIEPMTRAAIMSERWEIPKAAAPRIVEEFLRLLRGGAARKSYQLMRELGLLEVVLPRVEDFLRQTDEGVFLDRQRFWEYLESVDTRRREGQDPSSTVLEACLLLHPVRAAARARGLDLENPEHLDELLQPLAAEMHLPRRELDRLRQILGLLPRLEQPPPQRGRLGSVLSRPYFEDALLLSEIGVDASGEGADAAAAWRALASGAPAQQRSKRRRRRGGRRRPPRAKAEPTEGQVGEA